MEGLGVTARVARVLHLILFSQIQVRKRRDSQALLL
jgi:hypothetical protein